MSILVIPCYNEERRLDVERFLAFLQQEGGTRFLFVDDGSTDNTGQRIREIQDRSAGRVFLLSLQKNSGKAEAVRQGILHALELGAEKVGFWDADLATPLYEIPRFTAIFREKEGVQLVCGSRVLRLGTDISRKWYRHYPGRVIATLVSMILGIPVYDSQCGSKIFSAELAARIFATPFLSPWLFDVEVLARMIGDLGREKCCRVVFELPLSSWHDVGESKISAAYMFKVPLELAKIYFHYRKQLKG